MMNNTEKLLEDSLLVIWNDRSSEKRKKSMEEIYAPDIAFYESDDGPAIIGFDAIDTLITNLQSQWPPEFVFQLTAAPRINHQVQHIQWRLGVPGQPPAATGMDIAIIQNGRIKSLHLLLDSATQP